MSTQVTVASLPECDLCKSEGKPPEQASYDGKTVFGPWAFMCESHWLLVGVGQLGTGYGQKLVVPPTTT